MQECYFSRSPEILVDLQFVFENILIFCVNKCNSQLCFGSKNTNAVGKVLLHLWLKYKHMLLH